MLIYIFKKYTENAKVLWKCFNLAAFLGTQIIDYYHRLFHRN